MKRHILIVLLALTGVVLQVRSEESVDKLRTQSGVDPTRVTTRVGYSFMYYVQEGGNAQINNRLAATLGVDRWSFSFKSDFVSNNHDDGFRTGYGDLKFTILNAFYVKDKVALAGSVEFGLPTATRGFGGAYFSATPALTLSYTISPSLFFAVQPQYSFNLARNRNLDNMSVASMRIFLAKFTSKGYFFVGEIRPIYNLKASSFDLIIAPILGKSLGGGYNLIFLAEIPTKKATIKQTGLLFQLGFNKSF